MSFSCSPTGSKRGGYAFIDSELPTNTLETSHEYFDDDDDDHAPLSVNGSITFFDNNTKTYPSRPSKKTIIAVIMVFLVIAVGVLTAVLVVVKEDANVNVNKVASSATSDDPVSTTLTLTMVPTQAPVLTTTQAPVASITQVSTTSPTIAPTSEPTLQPIVTVSPTQTPTNAHLATLAPTLESCGVLNFTFSEFVNDELLDIMHDGHSPGDVYSFDNNNVYVDTHRVGTSNGRCVVLEDAENWDNSYCTMEFQFIGGHTIVVQGVFYIGLNVIGGTGCFSGLQGSFQLVDDPLGFDRYAYDFVPENRNCTSGNVEALFGSPWLEVPAENWTQVDWDQDGKASPGDVIVFDNNTFTTVDGATGTAEGECVYLYDPAQDSVDPFCSVTFRTLAGDILMAQGKFDNMIITSAQGCFFGTTGIISGERLENLHIQYTLNVDDKNRSSDPSCPLHIFDMEWSEPLGDTYINYIFDAEDNGSATPGDGYLFQNKPITVSSLGISGTLSGRCMFLVESTFTYCSIVFQFDHGSIAVQGFYGEMTVVGASGCFQGLTGVVYAEELDYMSYLWNVDFETTTD